MLAWPFNIKIVVRFITVALTPLCIIFFESLVSLVCEKFYDNSYLAASLPRFARDGEKVFFADFCLKTC
jgi:hypothetical protein